MTEPEWAWRTQSGHFITSADCDALAAEADAGYDPDQLTERRTMSDPPENPKVTLPHSSQEFDLGRLNRAMDAVLEAKSEGAGRYALVHTHGWPATDAVEYARAALYCIENSIDPNELGGT